MLGRTYRFVYYNGTGQALPSSSPIVTKARRWNFNSSGVQTWEASEANIDSTGNALAPGSYQAGGNTDNSTNAYLGGTFKFQVTTSLSSNGPFIVYLQRSTDGGTSWPDNGEGDVVWQKNITGSSTFTGEVEL